MCIMPRHLGLAVVPGPCYCYCTRAVATDIVPGPMLLLLYPGPCYCYCTLAIALAGQSAQQGGHKGAANGPARDLLPNDHVKERRQHLQDAPVGGV